MVAAPSLSNLQLELLKLFSREVPEQELRDIKLLIANYYAEKASDAMDQLFEKKGWGDEKLKEWENAHLRTPYK